MGRFDRVVNSLPEYCIEVWSSIPQAATHHIVHFWKLENFERKIILSGVRDMILCCIYFYFDHYAWRITFPTSPFSGVSSFIFFRQFNFWDLEFCNIFSLSFHLLISYSIILLHILNVFVAQTTMQSSRHFTRNFSFRPYLPSEKIVRGVQPILFRQKTLFQENASSSSCSPLVRSVHSAPIASKGSTNSTKPARRFSSVATRQNVNFRPAFSMPGSLLRFSPTSNAGMSVQHCREHARRMQHGKAFDTLNKDYPELFERPPDFGIYSDDISFEVRGTGPYGIFQFKTQKYKIIWQHDFFIWCSNFVLRLC